MVLFINACARPQSRTLTLAKKAAQTISESFEMLNLYGENLKPLDYDNLLKREEAIKKADFSDPSFRFARQFREADEIIMAVPYWDLSFPAILKCYIESICVNGLTFIYNQKGLPQGAAR